MADETLFLDRIKTPLGTLRVIAAPGGALRQLGWFDEQELPAGIEFVETRDPFGVSSTLLDYFAGQVEAIDSLAVDGQGTPFQRRVWQALREVPAGATATYGEIAARVGCRAARAVGGANHVNPIGIVVPCHRIIGKDGTLTGYAGGLDRKRWLLAHEARYAERARGRQIELRA